MSALFEVHADARELHDALEALKRRGEDASPIMRVVAAQLDAEVSDVFDAEGPGWAPLAVSTLRQRRKKGSGAKILQDTGRLAGSFQQRSGPTFAEVTTDAFYAGFHVFGAGVPKRDFTALPERAWVDAERTILEMLTEAA